MNIINELIMLEYADNGFSAAGMANGLRFADCQNDDERLERARIYRLWRPVSKNKGGIKSREAFDLAIAHIEPGDYPEKQLVFEAV